MSLTVTADLRNGKDIVLYEGWVTGALWVTSCGDPGSSRPGVKDNEAGTWYMPPISLFTGDFMVDTLFLLQQCLPRCEGCPSRRARLLPGHEFCALAGVAVVGISWPLVTKLADDI